MASFVERMIGAAKLDANIYEEVEADKTATGQAVMVVVLAAIMSGVAQLGTNGVAGMIGGAIGALIGWVVWAFLIYIVGTKLLAEPQTQSNMGELLRTIGFASAPGILYVLGGVPAVGPILTFLIWCWTIAAFVVAVRQALDYKSTGRAIAVVLIGAVVYGLIALFVVGMIMAAVIGAGIAAGGATN
ncbi:MAG TPA: YIP1 family protein [Candidatus Acidoferrales bacterium]|nr:YIP1 family protein [Candidatus Acidoferrales bacterium]